MVTGTQTSGLYLASSQRILILDDNENNRLGLRLFLRDVAKSPELIEASNALSAMHALKISRPFDIIFISPNTIDSSVSLYFLWQLRQASRPNRIYLIVKNADTNPYLNHFIDAEGVLMLDDPAEVIRQKLRQIIHQANPGKSSTHVKKTC